MTGAIDGEPSGTLVATGSSADLVPPPAPSCDDPLFEADVTFGPDGAPTTQPRFGFGQAMVDLLAVPGFSAPPGTFEVGQVITHDGYGSRGGATPQTSERVRLEFYLDTEFVAATPYTTDLDDRVRSTWNEDDLGSVELPDGADLLLIVHSPLGSSADSLVVSGICGGEAPATTTAPTTSTAPVNTAAPTTSGPTSTQPDNTVSPTSVTAPPTTGPPTTGPATTTAPPPPTQAPTSISVDSTIPPTTEGPVSTPAPPPTSEAPPSSEAPTDVPDTQAPAVISGGGPGQVSPGPVVAPASPSPATPEAVGGVSAVTPVGGGALPITGVESQQLVLGGLSLSLLGASALAMTRPIGRRYEVS